MLIKGNLVGGVRRSFVRLLLMGAALLLLLAATVLQRLPVPALQEFSAQLPMFYLVFDFVLLVGACAAGYPILRSGLSALVRLKGTSDSALSFAALAALVQQAAAFTAPWRFSVESGLNVYAVLVVLGLFLSSWGKFVMVRRVQENFKFVSSPDAKYAARIYTDEAQATKMCKGLVVGSPVMAYQQPTDLLSHFLQLSYEPDPSEKLAGKASVFSTLASIRISIAYFAFSRDILAALSVLAVAACVCTPLCAALAVNLPIKSLCKKAAGMGAMLSGYPAVRQFCDVNAVVLDAQELYPAGSVVLHGIKGFSGQRIDEAILQASAVMQQVGGPMSSTFDQIIKGKSEMLPKVESVVYEDEMGLVAWVGGQRVLLGNRRLLEEHGIMPPSRDYERQYKKDGRQLTYLATAGELVAMFVLSYTPNEEMAAQMRALEDHGVSFLVRHGGSQRHGKNGMRTLRRILPFCEDHARGARPTLCRGYPAHRAPCARLSCYQRGVPALLADAGGLHAHSQQRLSFPCAASGGRCVGHFAGAAAGGLFGPGPAGRLRDGHLRAVLGVGGANCALLAPALTWRYSLAC